MKISLDKYFLTKDQFLNKIENALNLASFYKIDFDWLNKEKWLDLLNKARSGDNEAYNLLNPSFFNDLLTVVNKNTRIRKKQLINDCLNFYLNSNFEEKGKYQSFYSCQNNLLYRISDHTSCSKINYIFINKKIRVSSNFLKNESKYFFDIVVDIPNFFNINRKKEALFLILKKNKEIIYKTLLHHKKIINEPFFSTRIRNL